MNAAFALDPALGFLAGLALGALHLLWLRRSATGLASGTGSVATLLGGAVLRIAVVIAVLGALAAASQRPDHALPAALIGLVLARIVGLWRARRAGR